jgi:hypothetical protein
MLPEGTCTLYCHGPYDLSEIHCQRLTTKAGGSISVGIFHSQLPEKVATGGGLTWNVTCCTRSSFATARQRDNGSAQNGRNWGGTVDLIERVDPDAKWRNGQ